MGDIADKGLKIGAAVIAGATAAVGGMVGLAYKAGNTADRLLDLNSITGMSTDEIQRWERVTKVAGVSADAMTNASQKLTKSLDTMSEGTGKGAEALEKLGYSYEQISSMSADERMNVLTTALSGVEDKTERARIGTDLFGGSWKEIAPIVDLGTEAMEKAKNSANIISNEDLVKANDFRISMDTMKDNVSHLAMELGITLLPMAQKIFDWFASNMPQIQEVATGAFGMIEGAIGFIIDNSNILIPILGGLLGAFLALKIISVISGLMAAYTAFTTTATGAQLSLSAAMMANPIGLIIAAIAALIAIGITLYKNWDTVKDKALSFWSNLKSTFNKVYTAISEPFQKGQAKVKEVIDKIKGFLNFKWEFPNLKLPHFSISGSVNPLKWLDEGIPKIAVKWYAKGGIFDKPTIFNTPYGLKGVGEAGPEAVLPLTKSVLGTIGESIAENMPNNSMIISLLIELIEAVRENKDLIIDGKSFAKLTGDYTDAEGGNRVRRIQRGLAL